MKIGLRGCNGCPNEYHGGLLIGKHEMATHLGAEQGTLEKTDNWYDFRRSCSFWKLMKLHPEQWVLGSPNSDYGSLGGGDDRSIQK